MRVVLDSNVLPSALLSPTCQAWRDRRFDLVTCPIQLAEIRRASRYPRLRSLLRPHEVGRLVAMSTRVAADPPLDAHDANDPADIWLLAVAEAEAAGRLVTGDHRSGLLGRRGLGRTRVVTVAAFCDMAL